MKERINFLKAEFPRLDWVEDLDFSRRATIGCGGKAKLAVRPATTEEWVRLIDFLEDCSIRYKVLGRTSNVLPADEPSDCVYLLTDRLKGVRVGEKTFAYAGTTAAEFLRVCKNAGRTGAEFLAGIPCSIGGAAYMNAGAGGRYLNEVVDSVLYYGQKQLRRLSLEECRYAYKDSVFMGQNGVILGVCFALKEETPYEAEQAQKRRLEERKRLPKGKSMGCIFKNPMGKSAGALIEGAGLKGLSVGGAVVSEEHANFIINEGGATAEDIKRLISLVKNAVFAQYKVKLCEEIEYLD